MNSMRKLVPKMKFKEEINKTNNFSRLNLINNKLKIKRDLTEESSSELNHSWHFYSISKFIFSFTKNICYKRNKSSKF